jgi:catechol 2,3-dioxygenase-like lactoylglutathione lyase family enzyme
MTKLRHIAIAVADPDSAAATLRDVFEFTQVGGCDNALAKGVFLSDGTVNIALLRFHTDQLGKGLDFTGPHHIGFLVDDMAKTRERLAEHGVPCVMDRTDGDEDSSFEVKFMHPAGFLFDIADATWLGAESLEDSG